MTRGEDVVVREEGEEEGEVEQQASACSKNVTNPSINSCLLMYFFSSPLPVNVGAQGLNGFSQPVTAVHTDANESASDVR